MEGKKKQSTRFQQKPRWKIRCQNTATTTQKNMKEWNNKKNKIHKQTCLHGRSEKGRGERGFRSNVICSGNNIVFLKRFTPCIALLRNNYITTQKKAL